MNNEKHGIMNNMRSIHNVPTNKCDYPVTQPITVGSHFHGMAFFWCNSEPNKVTLLPNYCGSHFPGNALLN